MDAYDDEPGICDYCGQPFLYDLCSECSGIGVDGDDNCGECDGTGQVLTCDCWYEARAQSMNDPAWYG